ncbi:DUF1850 domain-containing protein [Bacillus taeanensis]|uniref:DUF1850 domain-containing protein n=1 Tax=Bacillus taeanensis TaxID=273032 RepID=A0A366XU25_9BACI|nr:DUF1850 domain-containing protein [Bacillus taeanensis]RBW67471.1 DUF1850 domain-containing protein [Bacillus taeanensis]
MKKEFPNNQKTDPIYAEKIPWRISIFPKEMTIQRIMIPLIMMLFFVSLSSLIPFCKVLAVEYEDTAQLLAFLRLEHNDQFKIMYTHSVHLTPVIETYHINSSDHIIQSELEYENFAIGMPSNASGEERFIHKNGKYYISNMNLSFPYIDVRVGRVIANHTIIYKKQAIPFKEFAGPGTWTRLKVKNVTLWQMMKGVEILE